MKAVLLSSLFTLICFKSLLAASAPISGKLISRASTLVYTYTGELPIAPLERPTEGEGYFERETTFRTITYSGSYYWQLLNVGQYNSTYGVISGARVYDASTGMISQNPTVQFHHVTGLNCGGTQGAAKGDLITFTNFYPPGIRWPSSRTFFEVGIQGDNICYEEHYPPSNGYPGSTEWYRDGTKITYSDPDTEEDAMARADLDFNSERASFHKKSPYDERTYIKQHCFFSAKFTEGCGLYRVRFIIKKQPLDGGIITEKIKEVVLDLGQRTQTQEIELKIEDGYETWVEPQVLAFPMDCSDCSSDRGEPGHGSGPQAGSVDWSIPLGRDSLGQSLGALRLYAETLSANMDTPEHLVFLEGPSSVSELTSDTSSRRQYVTNRIIAEVATEALGGSSIEFYHLADASGQDAEGLFLFTEAPYLIWRVQMVATGDPDELELKITKSYNGNQEDYVFSEDSNPIEGFRFQSFASANGLRTTEKTYYTVPGEPNLERVVTVVKDEYAMISSKTEEFLELFDWGKTVVREVRDPDGVARITRHEYETFDGSVVANNFVVKETYLPDGKRIEYFPGGENFDTSQTTYAPSSGGGWDLIAQFNSNKGQPDGFYGDGVAESTLSRAQGDDDFNILRRVYTARHEDTLEEDGSYYSDYEIQKARYLGDDFLDGYWYISAWNDPTNFKSYRREHLGGPFAGRSAWEKHEDGTVETWDYSEDPVTGVLTTVHLSGRPDPSDDKVVIEGIHRTIETAPSGVVLLDVSVDIASGLTIARTEVVLTDESGRATHILHLDGSTEIRTYSDCCGHLQSITRHGRTVSYEFDALGRKIAEVRDGLRFEHKYDGNGRLLRTTRYGSDDTPVVLLEQTFNLAGELTSRSENGLAPTLYSTTYPGDGTTVSTTTLPGGGTIIETTNPDGSRQSRSGTAVAPLSWTYAPSGDYFEDEEVVELITEYRSATEWMQTSRDMTGRTIATQYPPAEGETEAANSSTLYNTKGQATTRIDPDGVQTLFDYDDLLRQSTQVLDMDRDAELDFAGEDRITRTQMEYGLRGSIPVQRTTTSRWDTVGSNTNTIISVTERSLDGLQSWQTTHGLTTHTLIEPDYDSSGGRRQTTTYPDMTSLVQTFVNERPETNIQRDINGQTLARTDFTYYPHGQLHQQIVQGVGTTTYTWYASGQLESVTTPDPDLASTGSGLDAQTTTYYYNTAGQVERIVHPDTTETHSTYWPDGQLRRSWGSRQYPVEYSYTTEGRLDTQKTWQNFSDENSAVITTWDYDTKRGWLKSKEIADSNDLVEWKYTPAGRVDLRINARAIETDYQYNDGGDLSIIDYSDTTPDVTRTFDRAGRITTTSDASGNRSHDYDYDRASGETYLSGPLAGHALTRDFDPLLRLGSVDVLQGGFSTHRSDYAYTVDTGRLDTVAANGLEHGYGYAPDTGLPDIRTVSENTTTLLTVDHHWDRIGRLESIASSASGDTHSYAYLYNDTNQRSRMTLANGRYWNYSYDALGQLDAAGQFDSTNQPLPGRNFGFTFDDIGNRITATTNGRTANYTPDDLNQYDAREVPGSFDLSGDANAAALVTVNGTAAQRLGDWFHGVAIADNSMSPTWESATIHAVLAGQGDDGTDAVAESSGSFFLPKTPEVFAYDADGNLTHDGRWSYTWDAENRLIQMETLPAADTAGAPKQRLTFGYDSQNRRFSKTVETWDIATAGYALNFEYHFLYDNWNLVAEFESDRRDSPEINRTTYYTWGPDLSGSMQGAGGVGGLLSVKQESGSTYLPFFDGNGNVMGYYDVTTGENVAQFEYGPFGELIRATGSKKDDFNFRFSTKYQDTETGLLYYGFRYYDAGIGRWLSRDPIGENGGLNLYGMVDNDPVNFIDDLGQNKKGYTGPVPEGNRPQNSYPKAPTPAPTTSPNLVSGSRGANGTGGAVVDAVSQISRGVSSLAVAGLKRIARQECAREQARRGDGCFTCHYWIYSVTYHSFFLPSSTLYHGGGGNVYRGKPREVKEHVENTNFLEPSFIRHPKRETQDRIDFYESW